LNDHAHKTGGYAEKIHGDFAASVTFGKTERAISSRQKKSLGWVDSRNNDGCFYEQKKAGAEAPALTG
jgi:hypothetical protein